LIGVHVVVAGCCWLLLLLLLLLFFPLQHIRAAASAMKQA